MPSLGNCRFNRGGGAHLQRGAVTQGVDVTRAVGEHALVDEQAGALGLFRDGSDDVLHQPACIEGRGG